VLGKMLSKESKWENVQDTREVAHKKYVAGAGNETNYNVVK
jgi:hypothetical protein